MNEFTEGLVMAPEQSVTIVPRNKRRRCLVSRQSEQ